jgi:glutaredoxin
VSLRSWLSRWWRGRRLEHVEVILYTRQGCHLCETAHEQLEAARRHWGFRLSVIDVDGDPELVRQHGESVPVVLVDGKVRFRGAVNAVLLTRLLRARGG